MVLRKLKAALLLSVSGIALGAWSPPERAAYRTTQKPIVHEPNYDVVVSSESLAR